MQDKKFQRSVPKPQSEDSMSNSMIAGGSKRGSEDEDEKDHESGNEYEGNTSIQDGEGEEDDQMSQEECEKKIDKLTKVSTNMFRQG